MRSGLRQFAGVVRAELRRISRDRVAFIFTAIFPVISLVIFGPLIGGKSLPNPKVKVVNLDRTHVDIPHAVERPASDLPALKRAPDGLVVVVPKGYHAALGRGERATLEVWSKPGDVGALIGEAQLREAIVQGDFRGQRWWTVVPRPISPYGGSFLDFFLPGMLGLTLAGGVYIGAGEPASLRQTGVLRHMFSTPLRGMSYAAGWALARLVFLIPQLVLMVVIGKRVLNASLSGSPLAAGVVVVLSAWMFFAIGVAIASFAGKPQTSSLVATVIMLPMYFVSATFAPTAKGGVIGVLHDIAPLTYVNNALRGALRPGGGFRDALPGLGVIVIWLLVACGVVAFRAGHQRVFVREVR